MRGEIFLQSSIVGCVSILHGFHSLIMKSYNLPHKCSSTAPALIRCLLLQPADVGAALMMHEVQLDEAELLLAETSAVPQKPSLLGFS
jgi:hypothetical protein